MTDIQTLDPHETNALLNGGNTSLNGRIAAHLMDVIDSPSGVFVVGLNESTINALRTRMYRHNVKVTVRKATRPSDGQAGHLLMAKSVPA